MVGGMIKSSEPFALDYYGYLKKSTGFFDLVSEIKKEFDVGQIKSLEVMVVHFASLK